MPTTTFTVDRETWLNGSIPDVSSVLLDKEGRRCCLGFYAAACGVPDEKLLGIGTPDDVGGPGIGDVPHEMRWLVRRANKELEVLIPSGPCAELVTANDSFTLGPKAREKAIAEIFADAGIEVVFEG